MRILCHSQHLTGVGHFVRMQTLARGLCAAHEVHLVSGGRPIPRRGATVEPEPVPLPPLTRLDGTLVAWDTDTATGQVIAQRARALAQAVGRIQPDVILIDHYPFSKWELTPELSTAIDTARRCTPAVRVVCSLRDIVRQTRHERVEPPEYRAHVLAALAERFDAIVMHSDPRFTRLEDHFDANGTLGIPVAYTGFVSAPLPPAEPAPHPYAVLSCGGGARHREFLLQTMEAFRRVASDDGHGHLRLIVFAGAFADAADLDVIEAAARGGPFQVQRFGTDFERHLAGCTLSISRAGYNTCAALLAARVRAVLVPDPTMSDQGIRAQRLAALGIAQTVDGETADIAAISRAIRAALDGPRPHHQFALDGVARTRALIESPNWWRPDGAV